MSDRCSFDAGASGYGRQRLADIHPELSFGPLISNSANSSWMSHLPPYGCYTLIVKGNKAHTGFRLLGIMRGRETVERHHLTRRGNTWFVPLDVPAALRPTLGRRLSETTKTSDIMIARERREPILARFRAQVARAHAEAQTPGLASFLQLEKAAADAELKAQRLVQQAAQERDAAKWALDQLATAGPKPHPRHAPPGARRRAVLPHGRRNLRRRQTIIMASRRMDASTYRHAFPTLAEMPVAEITVEHVLSVIQQVWTDHPVTGDRLRRVLESILDYARGGHRPVPSCLWQT
jgi:hypothetical protein